MKTLRSINDTYLFKLYDKTLNLNGTMLKLMQESEVLSDTQLAEYISSYDRRYNFPLKNKTLQDYRSGRVKVIYNNKNYKLPNTIPCFLVNNHGSITCIVNVSNYMTVNRNGIYNIEPKYLYSLMQGGTILATCYEKYSLMRNKASLIKLGSSMYSKLFVKIINKSQSLNITPAKIDIITFLSSMFFITNLLGRDEESLLDINIRYALENCKNSSKMVIEDYMREFDFETDFKSLDVFIKAISEKIPGLEDLTVTAFTENYLTAYGANMLMGLEFLPTFIFNLGAIQTGSYLNNQSAIEKDLGSDIDKFISEFSTL